MTSRNGKLEEIVIAQQNYLNKLQELEILIDELQKMFVNYLQTVATKNKKNLLNDIENKIADINSKCDIIFNLLKKLDKDMVCVSLLSDRFIKLCNRFTDIKDKFHTKMYNLDCKYNTIVNNENMEMTVDRDVLNANRYVSDKHQQILKIEQELNNLNNLFKDMAFLVVEQSEMIDVIENNIEKTRKSVTVAISDIKKSRKYQKKTCIIM